MKKVGLALLIVGAVLMLSGAAFALQPISDNQMAAITAQSGVSIAVDDVVLYNHFDNIAYKDNDGTDGTPATVNLSNFSMLTYINAIGYDDGTTNGTAGWYSLGGMDRQGDTNYGYTPALAPGTHGFAQALTIDVGTQPILSAGYSLVLGGTPTVTGVMIGLPTLEIYVPSLSVTPTVTQSGALNTGANFGTIAVDGMTTAVLGGHLEIAPH